MSKDAENSWLTNIYQSVKGVFATIDQFAPLSARDGWTYGYLLLMADHISPLMAASSWCLTQFGLKNDHDTQHTAIVASFGMAMPLLLKNSNDAIPAFIGETTSFILYNALQGYFPQYFKVENELKACVYIVGNSIWYFRSEIYSDYHKFFSSDESVEIAGVNLDNPE